MIIIVNLPSHSTSDSRNAQGWEFAHLMSMQITRFLSKNKRFAHNCSFPLRDLLGGTGSALPSKNNPDD